MSSTDADVDSTLGAAFLGNLVASMLYGIICIQAFLYLKREHGTDKAIFRHMVWLLDTTHLAFITHALYHYMISNYGNSNSLLSPTCFLGRRAWFMTGRNILLTLCILVPSLIAFGKYILYFVLSVPDLGYDQLLALYLLYLGLGSGLFADSVIATTLCVALWRSRTGFPRTDSIVNTLILYTINTCDFCSLTCFITYAVWPHKFIFLGFFFLLNKLYFNSLLAILNGQDHLQDQLEFVSDSEAQERGVAALTQ
ncbi:hypothetical protein BD779DRAFT_1559523 [Infundibulicybe gibba]|nr:hypothetical protein BD779DRAFT_1559523 [Infundibulicybe gibba]